MEKSSGKNSDLKPYQAPDNSVRKVVFLGDAGVGKTSLI